VWINWNIGIRNLSKFFISFTYFEKKPFYQHPYKVAIEYGDWLDLVANQTIEQVKRRSVLIIC
jgi:hypothetical protein